MDAYEEFVDQRPRYMDMMGQASSAQVCVSVRVRVRHTRRLRRTCAHASRDTAQSEVVSRLAAVRALFAAMDATAGTFQLQLQATKLMHEQV
jgi:hypothetical protein